LRFYTVLAPDAPAAGTWVTPDAGEATPIDTGSRYVLVARGADGGELARAGVVVEPVHTHEGNVEIASGRVPAAGAASVALLDGRTAIAEIVASKSTPKVKVLSPRSRARVGGRAVTVRWRATDADGDALTVVVEYSADGGTTWQGIHSGPSAGRVRLPGRLFASSRRARLRVRAQDGFREGIATSPGFVSRGAPPLVTIRSPAKGATVGAGTALALAGDAYDDRGSALTGKRLVWYDGKRRLGSGERIVTSGLAPGRHTIVLEGRDRLGRRDRARVGLNVGAGRPQLKLLKAPARLNAKARVVKLTLAATFPIRVKVAGRSFAVGTTPRSVRVKVKPGRTLLPLRLVLSAGGRRSTVEQQIARG
jgi:hypothetical protein